MHAKICIERIRGQDVEGDREIRFDDIRVEAAGQETIEIVFANAAGDRVRLVLARAHLKELVSWKTLLSL